MSKRSLLTLSSLALYSTTWATPAYLPAGPNLTYGDVSNNQTIISSVTNPAAGASVFTKDKNQYRFGILSSIGAGIEYGKVDDLFNELDKTQKDLQSNSFDVTSLAGCAPESFVESTCKISIAAKLNQDVIDPANRIIQLAEKDGNASIFLSGKVPLFPIVISKEGWGGSFVLDANYSAKVNLTLLGDSINKLDTSNLTSVVTLPTTPTGSITYDLKNDSALLLKAGAVGEVGLGYSRPIKLDTTNGNLYGGFRAKYYSVGLERLAQRLQSTTDSQDFFKDKDIRKDMENSSGFGVDLGAVWVAKHYRLGGWVDNLNKPSFSFNKVDVTGFTDPNIISRLSQDETYTMDPQGHIEAALYSESKNWVVSLGADTNAVKDPVGQEYQWLTASAAYATDSWLIPGIRVGYRANNAATKLNYGSVGFTLFKCVTLDASASLDSVKIDGNSMPRSAMVNLGIELSF